MKQETKNCQNCKQSFTIEPEDFEFYAKIKVPPPTWCPECRMIRRLTWRNERVLYKRKNDAPDKREDTVSIYSQEKPVKVYDQQSWWSDTWDPIAYGEEYDFSRPFFTQFIELLKTVPLPALDSTSLSNIINSTFCNDVWDIKNCYYCTTVGASEDCYYCFWVVGSKNVFDSFMVLNGEHCIECINCDESYKLFYSQNCLECIESYFLYDCKNCNNCFGCVGLRNKSYHIFNRPYAKEDYFRELETLFDGKYKTLTKTREKWHNFILQYPRRYAVISNSTNVTGDSIYRSKNCAVCFDVANSEDCKYMERIISNVKDCYDIYNSGYNVERSYEVAVTGIDVTNVIGSLYAVSSFNVTYSFNVHNCSNLFGCIGLRNKQYCILNKQYTKEEYEKLFLKIIEHMSTMPYVDKKGRVYKYGEFFPPELSPFSYNETMAQEYFPLSKEKALEKGYSWKDSETKEYTVTLKSKVLPDHIKDVQDDVLNQTIDCEHEGQCKEQCSTAFRIISQELEFYRKHNIPLPRLCPNCRHYQRLKQRNPLKLWKRKCTCAGIKSDNEVYTNTIQHFHKTDHCPKEFETSYAPDRPEIVYCEQCYQNEVV